MARPKSASPVKKWKPASEEWIRAFAKAAAAVPRAEQRKMFGYPAMFVNGNMFAGLHESGLVLRLPDRERETFLKLRGAAQFEPMPGRPMREYVVAPSGMAGQQSEVEAWLKKAFDYGATLPVKTKAGARKSPGA